MKTPTLLLTSLGLALAANQVQAQVFQPGWVLLAKGDTLRGEVEDNAWEEAPERVRFRAAAGAAIETYTVPTIRAFRLREGRFFRLETLPLDRGAQKQLSYLAPWLTRKPQPETFLVEVLVDGPASLLRTAVADVQHYYVRRAGQPALELAERYYLREQDGRQTMADGNNYKGELLTYFGDCPAAAQAIGRFEASALVAVVQAYNRQCATPPQAGIEYRRAGHRRAGATRRASYRLRRPVLRLPWPATMWVAVFSQLAGYFLIFWPLAGTWPCTSRGCSRALAAASS
jgi:hypothetical protein